MKSVMDAIAARRSVRDYTDQPVQAELLRAMVEAGQIAPSAMNTQCWHFSVVQRAEVIDRVRRAIIAAEMDSGSPAVRERVSQPGFTMFHNAGCIVVFSADAADKWGPINAALAAQNMMLAAEALGLGTCLIGSGCQILKGDPALAGLLGIPEGYAPVMAMTVGHPASTAEPKPRREGTATYLI